METWNSMIYEVEKINHEMDCGKRKDWSKTNCSMVERSKRRWIFDRNKKILKKNRRTKLILSGRRVGNDRERNLIRRRSMVLFGLNANNNGLKRISSRRYEMTITKNKFEKYDKIWIFGIDRNSNWSRRQSLNKNSATY